MSAGIPSSDFSQFCDFVLHLREGGAENLMPEQSVAKFREQQEKLRVWHERNALSQEQARRGLAKPLNDEEVISRLRKRLADHGITD